MEHCQHYFHQLSVESEGASPPPAVLQILQENHAEATKISSHNFGTLNQMVLSLDSPGQAQHWSTLWHKYQQTKQQLEETLDKAASTTAATTTDATTDATTDGATATAAATTTDGTSATAATTDAATTAATATTAPTAAATTTAATTAATTTAATTATASAASPPPQSTQAAVAVSGLDAVGHARRDTPTRLHGRKGSLPLPDTPPYSPISSPAPGGGPGDEDAKRPGSAGPFPKSPSGSLSSSSSHFLFFPGEGEGPPRHSPSPCDDTDSDCTMDSSSVSCYSEPACPSAAPRHRKQQPLKKIMKKTLSYELSPSREAGHSHGHGDASHLHGYTGVYIRGLEVTNSVSAEKKLQRPDVTSPALGRSRSMSSSSSSPSSRPPSRLEQADGNKQSR